MTVNGENILQVCQKSVQYAGLVFFKMKLDLIKFNAVFALNAMFDKYLHVLHFIDYMWSDSE